MARAIGAARSAGLHDILVVGRASDDEMRLEVEREGATFVVNPQPDEGQLSSLVAGLDAAEGSLSPDGVLVMPVDAALISAATIRTLLDRAALERAPILRATHEGRHGHPVLFKRDVFDELRRADPSVGAKAVVRADPRRVIDVEVDDPAVTIDIDTPEDYQRILGRRP